MNNPLIENDMNQNNLKYLQDQVKYTGFGEGLAEQLKEKIAEGKPAFKLEHTATFLNDSVTATLDFSKSKQSDMYFFNSYRMDMQKEKEKESIGQTFYVSKDNTVTFKEAYNLLAGRAVNKDLTNKEGEKYNAWLQMDFKQTDTKGNFEIKRYNQNYGYDLEKVLAAHPIKELENDRYKSNLIESLKKGNLQLATFEHDGKEQKQFIEANPRFKSINVYDNDMKRISSRQSKGEEKSEGESTSVKQDNKKEESTKQDSMKQESKKEKQSTADNDGPDIPKAANKRKRKQSQSM